MAAIREEYILADRFSASFTRLLGFLGRADAASRAAAQSQRQLEQASGGGASAMVRLAEAALDAAEQMGAAGDQAGEMARAATQAADASKRAVMYQERANASMSRGASAADNLGRRLLSLAGAYASLRTAQQFIGMTDTFTQTTARLDLVNEKFGSALDLQNMIYQSAQRSRAAYADTADAVAKMAMNAGSAFNGADEVVAFMEQINKQFAIAGADSVAQKNAMIQLTQAMSAGVLRGEELNSILDQAPGIARAIEQSMGWVDGSIKQYAEKGLISAQIVKNAMFDMAEETNRQFESIPLTFSQAWTMAGNAATRAMEPAMKRLNGLLNSELGQNAVNGLIAGFELLGSVAAGAVDLLAAGAQWVADNWDLITTILAAVAGVAALLAAKMALAGAVSVASALASAGAWALAHWPLLLLIGLAAAAGIAAKEMGLTFEDVFSAIGAGAGWLYVLGYNFVAAGWNLIAAFAEFFANVFDDPVAAIANLFLGLFNFIMDVVSNAAGAIDALLGTNLSGAVKSFQNGVNDFVTGIFGENKVKIERMEQISYGDTMAKWAEMGAGLGKSLDNFAIPDVLGGCAQNSIDSTNFMANSGIPGKLDQIGNDTAAIKRSVSLAEEDMKLLVDMAERQYVNNINLTAQTPVINVTGQNTGNTEMDRQYLANTIRDIIIEEAASHTDLSYR